MKDTNVDSYENSGQTSLSSLDALVKKNSVIKKLTLHFVSISILKPQRTQVIEQLHTEHVFQIAPSYCERKKVDKYSFLKRYIPVYLAELEPQDQAEMEIRYFWILPNLSLLIVDFQTQSQKLISYSKGKYFLMAMNISTKNLKKQLKFEYNRIN